MALAIVVALHLGVVNVLIIASETGARVTSAPNLVQLLVLPRDTPPKIPVSPPPPNRSRKARPETVPASSAITIDPSAAVPDNVGETIDWAQEAHGVADGIAKKDSVERRQESVRSPQSPFAPPPAHHQGEQIPTADGRWIVYVTDDCYQVSKAITSITNATNNGMSLQTYCTRRSKKPRGDLFDQLPEYKKLHPDN